MIARTLLTEALEVPARPVTQEGLEGLYALPLDVIDVRTVAARLLRDFPTDEQRQRAEQALIEWLPDTFGPWLAEGTVKTVVEAVRDTMIGAQ